MSVLEDLRKSVDTPFYAAVGMTDRAVQMAREARQRAEQMRAELTPAVIQARATEEATKVVDQAKDLPALALNRGLVAAGKVAESYEDLAERGHTLLKRVRTQQSTKDLRAQAEATMALGKGAMTSARKAYADVERSAKATMTTGRHEATRIADLIGERIAGETKATVADVEEGVKKTRTAAKRTTTTTKKATGRARTSAKATRTSARKTAASTVKATKKAAEKIGD